MSKRAVVNLALLVLVAVLAAVAYLQPGIEDDGQPERLTALTPAQVERLEIVRREGDRIALRRGESGWEIVRPIEVAANRFRVEPVLKIAQAESHARFTADEADLGQYGLASPSVTLRLNGLELRFGDSEPIDHRRYVMIGDTVHLIEDRYFYRTRSPLSTFVSLRLLPGGADPVAISLPEFSVERDPETHWRIAPARPGVSVDALNAFVERWRRAQAIEVTAYRGEAAGAGRVRIGLEGDAGPVEFLLVEEGPEPVLARPDIGMSYHLAEAQGGRLLDRPTEEGVRSEE